MTWFSTTTNSLQLSWIGFTFQVYSINHQFHPFYLSTYSQHSNVVSMYVFRSCSIHSQFAYKKKGVGESNDKSLLKYWLYKNRRVILKSETKIIMYNIILSVQTCSLWGVLVLVLRYRVITRCTFDYHLWWWKVAVMGKRRDRSYICKLLVKSAKFDTLS